MIFDVDYRPNLWGLAGHGAGEERYIRSDDVTGHLQAILPSCDVVVGTEEELHAAGGSEDTLEAIRAIRRLAPAALIVCKRGPMGCVAFPGAIPASIEEGVRGPGFPVEVYNVLGAGDAFMSGFLRGYLRNEKLETTLGYANACGAFAVSRLLCSPESPTWAELSHFLAKGSPERALRKDAELNHIHHATTRLARPETIRFLSIDHGWRDLGAVAGATRERIEAFKAIAVQAAADVAAGREGFGIFLDGDLGREALFRAFDHPLTVVRQFPQGSAEAASDPAEWPVRQIVKLIANARPDAITRLDIAALKRIGAASRLRGREVLVEALAAPGSSTAALVADLGAEGLKPDWWLVEPQPDAKAWAALDAAIAANDPFCRGAIVILRDLAEAGQTFALARRARCVRASSVGDRCSAPSSRTTSRAGSTGGCTRGAGCALRGGGPTVRSSGDDGMSTIRLTAAQAMVRLLAAARTTIDGESVPLLAGVWAIFGHGNVAAMGEALAGARDELPTYRAHNEQAMAHAAIAFAKQSRRRRFMACTSSIGPGATNMVTAAALAHVNRLPVLLIPGDVYASRRPDPCCSRSRISPTPPCRRTIASDLFRACSTGSPGPSR